jgi:hypothetical protein
VKQKKKASLEISSRQSELRFVWFDAPSHEEFEYVFGFDFRPSFSEIILQTLKITDFSAKNIFRDFGFSVANSILDIVSSE